MSNDQFYTIIPIKGMEFIQKNFVKYKDGDKSAEEFTFNKKVRFALKINQITFLANAC